MRAIEIHGPAPDDIRLVDRPEPQPGPSEVQVRLRAATLNFRDLAMPQAHGPYPIRTPYVPLSCGCGVVTAIGHQVTRVRVGDRVAPTFFRTAAEESPTHFGSALGGPLDGVAREVGCFPQFGVVKIPDGLSDLEAATLPCAGLTAWNALFCARGTKPGDVVLLLGTGGVSIAALQLAKAVAATVIITSSSDAKLARAVALGADATVNYRETPAWGAKVRELTGGRGADVVLEVGGTGTLEQSIAALRPGGDIASIGLLAGEIVAQIDEAKVKARLHLIRVGTREELEDMLRGIVSTSVRPVVDQVFPLEQIGRAMACLRAGHMVGKIGIEIGC
jgi:NADPH:quinone reductase-like Zn-dependent oxidoreductase